MAGKARFSVYRWHFSALLSLVAEVYRTYARMRYALFCWAKKVIWKLYKSLILRHES